jgi:RHS repeat-associated protein
VWRWALTDEAFGESEPEQDPDGDDTLFVLDMRYPGQQYDSATGFNYNYFRNYDPSTGRYSQSDPIGLQGGISTYGYVGGNPMIGTDPVGLAITIPYFPGITIGGPPSPPVIVGAIGLAVGAAVGTGINYLIESNLGSPGTALFNTLHPEVYSSADWSTSSSEQRRAEHAAYKSLQRAGPLYDPDPCRYLRNKINYHKELNRARGQWDANWPHVKWPNGRHFDEITNTNSIINRYEDQYKEMCENC